MLKLIELNEGERRELVQGSLKELVEYLEYNSVYDWQQEQDPDTELPNLEKVETVEDLEYELGKTELSWWKLEITK